MQNPEQSADEDAEKNEEDSEGSSDEDEDQKAPRLQENVILPQIVSRPKPQGPLEQLGFQPGTVAHAYNPSHQEAEAKEWLQV